MKPITTIFFLFIFCNTYGQKWHLNRVDSSAEFKYEYWFSFDHIDDTSSYVINTTIGKKKSSIYLKDNKGDTIDFSMIRITNLRNASLTEFLSDGSDELKLKPGEYNIYVSSQNFDKLSFNFTVIPKQYFDLNVKLGLSPELTVYQINSKMALSVKELSEIINCVKENKSDFSRCSVKNRYSVIMQL